MITIQLLPEGATAYQAVDMPQNFSFSIEDNSPLFAKDIIEGTFSLPITLPATPLNRRLFGHADNWHVSGNPAKRIKARILVNGIYHSQGTAIVRGVNSKGYRVNYQSKASEIGEKFKTKLTELPFAPVALFSTDNMGYRQGSDLNGNPPDDSYGETLPDGNRKWIRVRIDPHVIETDGQEYAFFIGINGEEYPWDWSQGNRRIHSVVDKINATEQFRARFERYPRSGNVAVYNPYVDFYIWQITPDMEAPLSVTTHESEAGWPYESVTIYDGWVSYWQPRATTGVNGLFNNTIADGVVAPSFYAPNFWQEMAEEQLGYFAAYINRPNIYNSGYQQQTSGSYPAYAIVPQFTLKWVLQQMALHTDTTISVDWAGMPGLDKLIIPNTQALNILDLNLGNTWYGSYQAAIKPGAHLPAMSITEFLLELKKAFALSLDFDPETNTLKISSIEKAITARPKADLTHKAAKVWELEYPELAGLQVGYKAEETHWSGTLVLSKTLGSGIDDYRSKFVPVAPITYGGTTKMTRTDHRGGWAGSPAEVKPMLSLFYGLSEDTRGRAYPFASSDNIDSAGNLAGPLSLSLAGSGNVYNLYLRKWAAMILTGLTAKGVLFLTVADLLQFQAGNVYRIDQKNFFVQKLTSTFSPMGLAPAAAELVAIQ